MYLFARARVRVWVRTRCVGLRWVDRLEYESGHPYSDGWHRPRPQNSAVGAPLQ